MVRHAEIKESNRCKRLAKNRTWKRDISFKRAYVYCIFKTKVVFNSILIFFKSQDTTESRRANAVGL